MKTDNFTKFILTVIAITLVVLVLQNAHIIGNVRAGSSPANSTLLVPVNPDGTISVRVKSMSDIMDVNIRQVAGSTVSEYLPVISRGAPVDVNIKQVAGSTIYDALPILPKGNVLDINIEELGGYKVYNKLPVEN